MRPSSIAFPACVGCVTLACLAVQAPADQSQLVPAGSVWMYLDTGVEPGASWTDPGFDDSGWASGPAQLGYGDGDEATVVSYGPDAGSKYITTWFRTQFDVADPSTLSLLRLGAVRDDGIVAYLNGTEVFRSNMPAGPVTSTTTASSAVQGSGESTFYETFVDSSLLVAGTNTLAAEIHQRGAASSDISFDLRLDGFGGEPTLSRGPYIQMLRGDGVVLRWRTNVPTDSVVRYADAPGNLTQTVTETDPTPEHVVTLTGLTPGTTWYYSVGDTNGPLAGDDTDHFFVTSPSVGARAPVRAWVLGDSGTANANAAAVRDGYLSWLASEGGRPADMVLMLGDNAYSDGTDAQYQAAVFDMYPTLLRNTVLWPTLGNHDGHSADSATESGPYYNVFSLPRAGESGGLASGTEAYYSFDYANVHFVCLDSYDLDRSTSGAMLTWLQADLASTAQEWLIALWHHPPYTKGSHDSDAQLELVEMRENAVPILEDAGVDLVLCGHSHSYERSFLIDGHYDVSGSFDPATMLVDGSDGAEAGDGPYEKAGPGLAPHEGTVYAVAGSSGQTSGGSLDHPVMVVSLNTLGSMVVDVNGNRLDARFITSTGLQADGFTILKPSLCVADMDGDSDTDIFDFGIFATNFGTSVAPGTNGDFDGSGFVDVLDFGVLAADFGCGS